MKNTYIAALLGAAMLPAASALVGNDWKLPGGPSDGLTDITFPINMANAPHKRGFYFAQQFGFTGADDIGYTGLQPRPDLSGGKPNIHVAFSSFIKGTTSDDANCSDGADGGSGVSCATEFSDSYADTYNLTVTKIGDRKWQGTAINTNSGKEYHVGSYTLPAGADGGVKSTQGGFVEYYPWNGQASHQCSELPDTEVTFYYPTTTNEGAGPGVVNKPYEYGDCVGKANFVTTAVDQGWDVKVGFVGGDGS